MKYECGCKNEVDSESGILHCIKKCDFHTTFLANDKDGFEYQERMGAIKEGIPQNKHYIEELNNALWDMQVDFPHGFFDPPLLEIGPGIGPYVPFFLHHGWGYFAVEKSEWSVNWLRQVYNATVHQGDFESFTTAIPFRVIFAAHCFEHMHDAPAMLKKSYDILDVGGSLYLVLPDDSDPTNPGHFWFFNQKSLKALLEKLKFRDIRMTMKKIVPHENFIYCVAKK